MKTSKYRSHKSQEISGYIDPVVVSSRLRHRQALKRNINAEASQTQCLNHCVSTARNTLFGKHHDFTSIKNYEDYKERVPLRTYDDLKPYMDRILAGENDVLWPGKPTHLLCTGGTSSGKPQLVPATTEGLRRSQIGTITSVMFHMAESGSSRLCRGKQVIIGAPWQGEPHDCGAEITKISGAGPGRLPSFVQKRMVIPSAQVANHPDFDKKMDLIVEEALRSRVVQISSMPVWLINFFERVGRRVGLAPEETLRSVWPELSMVLFTGASIKPYRHIFERWLGEEVPIWEQYSATEGLIAVKDSSARDDLLVLTDNDTFFEFVPIEEYGTSEARRFALWEVETDRDYVITLTDPNGLFSYVVGDVIRFTETRPYRLVVSGRVSLYLNTIGEHVQSAAIESAMSDIARDLGLQLVDFTAGPSQATRGETLHHDWLVECELANPVELAGKLDNALRRYASDYNWFRSVNALDGPTVTVVPPGTFSRWIGMSGAVQNAPGRAAEMPPGSGRWDEAQGVELTDTGWAASVARLNRPALTVDACLH